MKVTAEHLVYGPQSGGVKLTFKVRTRAEKAAIKHLAVLMYNQPALIQDITENGDVKKNTDLAFEFVVEGVTPIHNIPREKRKFRTLLTSMLKKL